MQEGGGIWRDGDRGLAATMTVKPAEHFSSLTVQDAETKSPARPGAESM